MQLNPDNLVHILGYLLYAPHHYLSKRGKNDLSIKLLWKYNYKLLQASGMFLRVENEGEPCQQTKPLLFRLWIIDTGISF